VWLCCVLRQLKQKENERRETAMKHCETSERTLFHGVKWRHLDLVARCNIDWRTTGFSHGVMFGEGKSV